MLKLDYYGQNDGTTVPNVTLTGDPGTDQLTLTNAGYLGGKIMAVVGTYADGSALVAPCDGATMQPYGALLNGPGEFAGAIGPSGSKKAPVVRALFKGSVDTQAYVATDVFVIGHEVFCSAAGSASGSGFYTITVPSWTGTSGQGPKPVAICTAVPSQQNNFTLGIASLI
jgi:hypothetical protein